MSKIYKLIGGLGSLTDTLYLETSTSGLKKAGYKASDIIALFSGVFPNYQIEQKETKIFYSFNKQ